MDTKETAINVKDSIYKYPVDKVYEALETGVQGLTKEQAEERQKKYGKNLLEEKKKKSVIIIFLSNFIHLMAVLLWVGGAVAFLAGMPQLGVAVWLVNVINGIFSFWQEHRASKATEALKNMLPSYARVVREGEEQKILAEDLVIGDIILLVGNC